jgi:hypothetical protein
MSSELLPQETKIKRTTITTILKDKVGGVVVEF